MLTGHQVILLRRQFPDATIERRAEEVMIEFPDGAAAGVELEDGETLFWTEMSNRPEAVAACNFLRHMLAVAA
jgi:hypothetical protein